MTMSPGQKAIHYLGSPVRFVKSTVDPGTVNQSTFSLVIICMGAGTITMPYVFFKNGVIFGTILLLISATLSLYTGYLITYCSNKTGGSSFEIIALRVYGEKGMRIISFCNILCNVGFLISYLTLVSTTL